MGKQDRSDWHQLQGQQEKLPNHGEEFGLDWGAQANVIVPVILAVG